MCSTHSKQHTLSGRANTIYRYTLCAHIHNLYIQPQTSPNDVFVCVWCQGELGLRRHQTVSIHRLAVSHKGMKTQIWCSEAPARTVINTSHANTPRRDFVKTAKTSPVLHFVLTFLVKHWQFGKYCQFQSSCCYFLYHHISHWGISTLEVLARIVGLSLWKSVCLRCPPPRAPNKPS